MHIILCDIPALHQSLLPFTRLCPIGKQRVGRLKLEEKWTHRGHSISYLAAPYLQTLYPTQWQEDNLLVNAALCYHEEVFRQLTHLLSGESLYDEAGLWLGMRMVKPVPVNTWEEAISQEKGRKVWQYFVEKEGSRESRKNSRVVDKPWKITMYNAAEIGEDQALLWEQEWVATGTEGKGSLHANDHDHRYNHFSGHHIHIHPTASVTHTIIDTTTGTTTENKEEREEGEAAEGSVFIHQTAQVKRCVLEGSVYIGEGALVEDSVIKGPCVIGAGSVVSGARVRSTTIGPYCKIGGEVSMSVLMGYSNKGHEGFLGHSVIGRWCNLGAGTTNSNLKNNYTAVSVWDYFTQTYVNTQQTFCGLFMGDHSKTAIQTSFNTGTVVGVFCHVLGQALQPKHIPDFSWATGDVAQTFEKHAIDKAINTASIVMKRRACSLPEEEKMIIRHLFKNTLGKE